MTQPRAPPLFLIAGRFGCIYTGNSLPVVTAHAVLVSNEESEMDG